MGHHHLGTPEEVAGLGRADGARGRPVRQGGLGTRQDDEGGRQGHPAGLTQAGPKRNRNNRAAQAWAFDIRRMTSTPARIRAMPTMAGRSSFWRKPTQPMAVMARIPTPDQMA